MRKFYGKLVGSVMKTQRKTCVYMPAKHTGRFLTWQLFCVKAETIPSLFRRFHLVSSTAEFSFSPLFEHIFYPVSTRPIISAAKLKS